MKDDFKGAAWRLLIFLTVCAFGTFALLTVFAEFRFGGGKKYFADFTNVSGLKSDDMVRIAGVEVGTIQDISFNGDSTVRVEFATDDSVLLTEGTRAAVRYDNVIGGRYLALEEGAGDCARCSPAQRSRSRGHSPPSTWIPSSAGSGRCSGCSIPIRSTR